MSTEPEADERRIASQLRRLGVGPDAESTPLVPPRPAGPPAIPTDEPTDWVDEAVARSRATRTPITPTRVIPSGTPLPQRPPEQDEVPPWRRPQPAAGPPAAPPPAPPAVPPPGGWHGPIEVHVQLLPLPLPPEPTPWERLASALRRIGRPWQICGALTLALLPIPGFDYSVATTWASCVTEARDAWGQGAGYALALIPLAWAAFRITRHGGTVLRLLLGAVAVVGQFGAIDLYDPVTWITGVHPS